MTELAITRGYPASGKSTWAKRLAKEPGWARVCRDDLREMLFSGDGVLEFELEQHITRVEQAQVEALLKAGVSVVVDATNLRMRYARAWADLALRFGAVFLVEDFIAVTVDECVQRDKARGLAGGRSVGEQVIRDMAAKFPYSRWEPVVGRPPSTDRTPEPYVADPSLPTAYLVDVDGTLARMDGRGPFEWDKVGDDKPVTAVIEVIRELGKRHHEIIVMSGRDEVCRDATCDWLDLYGVRWDAVLMRPRGDNRKDSLIKAELFDKHVRHQYQVLGVFDDRLSVCRQWYSMGLPLFRVGDPDADF